VNNQVLGFDAFHFVFRLGWLFQIKPQVKLGVMLQPPGIPLRQKVGVLSQGFVNDNRDTSMAGLTEAYFVDGKVNANLPIPLELEAGVEYFPAENVLLALDASFHGPVRANPKRRRCLRRGSFLDRVAEQRSRLGACVEQKEPHARGSGYFRRGFGFAALNDGARAEQEQSHGKQLPSHSASLSRRYSIPRRSPAVLQKKRGTQRWRKSAPWPCRRRISPHCIRGALIDAIMTVRLVLRMCYLDSERRGEEPWHPKSV